MNHYQAVIGEKKKYAVHAYGAAQAQYQIELFLGRSRASDAERSELVQWVANGRPVEPVDEATA